MNEIPQLIREIIAGEIEVKDAVRRLAVTIPVAVPLILDKIHQSSESEAHKLCQVLLQIHTPEIVPVFISLLGEENIDLKITALKALGQSKDGRALSPLLDQLVNASNYESIRVLAAEALGDLDNSQAIPELLKVSERAKYEDMFDLVLSVTVALAKLGNHQTAFNAISLTQYEDDPIIRDKAVRALKYAVGPGMLPALQAAIRDNYFEVRLHAIEAISYLGVREVIDDLIFCVEDEHPDIVNDALVRLHDITGEHFSDDTQAEELQAWWRDHSPEFISGICYRLGEPMYLPNIISLLEEPNWRNQVTRELRIITGVDFRANSCMSAHDSNELLQAQEWWQKEGGRFEVGQLYKYGYKQDICNVF